MIQVNILEQLIIFYNTLIKNKNVLLILVSAFVSLLGLTFASNLKNKKIVKIIYFILYGSIFGYLVYFYHGEILNLLDYLINNIFLFLFFPNLAIYILVLIIINVLLIKSTISFEESKFKKIINIIFFIVFNVIFYLIVNNIIDNNVNVYEQLSIYTNSDLLNLIELSMRLFIIWLIVFLLIKIINKINIYTSNRKFANSNLNNSSFDKKEITNQTSFNARKEDKMEFLEMMPDTVDKRNCNIYNTYINIEPVKKYKKAKDEMLNNKEIENKLINNGFENSSDSSLSVYHNYFSNLNVNGTSNDLQSNNSLNLEKVNLEDSRNIIHRNESLTFDEVSKKNSMPAKQQNNMFDNNLEINLASYDFIFEDPLENAVIEEEMTNIFSKNDNYLESINSEIEKLKNNQMDKNQIKEVYNKILINEDNLSLNDYNYLINRLLELKK